MSNNEGKRMKCARCNQSFIAKRNWQRFCTADCRWKSGQKLQNRKTAVGLDWDMEAAKQGVKEAIRRTEKRLGLMKQALEAMEATDV